MRDVMREKEQDNNLVEKKVFIFSKRDTVTKKRRIIAKIGVFCRHKYSICLGNSSFSFMVAGPYKFKGLKKENFGSLSA